MLLLLEVGIIFFYKFVIKPMSEVIFTRMQYCLDNNPCTANNKYIFAIFNRPISSIKYLKDFSRLREIWPQS